MMQRSRRLAGAVAPCPVCSRQPMHVEVRGPGLHFLECPPCELRTTREPSLQQALEAWESLPRHKPATSTGTIRHENQPNR